MTMYWRDFSGGSDYAGRVQPNGGTTGFQTYATHRFFWAETDSKPPVPTTYPGAVNVEFEVSEDQRLYYYMDDSTKPEVRAKLEEEIAFMKNYLETNGRHWVGTTWPRPPPTFTMRKPTFIGQEIVVPMPQDAGQWDCAAYNDAGGPDGGGADVIPQCYEDGGRVMKAGVAVQVGLANITLEVVSVTPAVFKIRNFLSDFEADYMIEQARPKLGISSVGHGGDARQAKQRTSKSAWLHRSHSPLIGSIYTRMGIATNVPDEAINERNVESINVLHYGVGAEYTPHFDWGADGNVASRFCSSLLYLNNPERGGGTTFPRAVMADGKIGTYVDAEKKNAVFFYDLLEDGNADELSLHSGAKVEAGEKWIAPLWIWEPIRWKDPKKKPAEHHIDQEDEL
jgi:prolyl 4-hydroxylase